MTDFAKIFGNDDAQVLVMRSQGNDNNQRVEFMTRVPGVGIKCFCTVFQANETAATDADAFFAAVTEDMANSRAQLIKEKWVPADSEADADSDSDSDSDSKSSAATSAKSTSTASKKTAAASKKSGGSASSSKKS